MAKRKKAAKRSEATVEVPQRDDPLGPARRFGLVVVATMITSASTVSAWVSTGEDAESTLLFVTVAFVVFWALFALLGYVVRTGLMDNEPDEEPTDTPQP